MLQNLTQIKKLASIGSIQSCQEKCTFCVIIPLNSAFFEQFALQETIKSYHLTQ